MSDNRQGNFQALLTTGLAMGLGATLMTVVGSNDATASLAKAQPTPEDPNRPKESSSRFGQRRALD